MLSEHDQGEEEPKYCIVVTRLQATNVIYAHELSMDSAIKLRKVAIGKGYRDARIENEKDFKEARYTKFRGGADSSGPRREAGERRLHDLRPRSEMAASR